MINLIFSGDFVPSIDSAEISDDHFTQLRDDLIDVDCHISNLECPITSVEEPVTKSGPSLKAPTASIQLLKQANVNVACLANNHIYDFGRRGLLDTISICDQNGIETIGIVNRLDGRASWLIKEIKGKRIGFLNYCEHESSVRAEGELGANGFDPVHCYYELSTLRPQVDRLFVIFHGGNEYYALPRPGLRKIFRYLADLGADAVIGHHPHVIGGYENYKGKPLVFSLGNFYFPWANEPKEWYVGMLLRISLGDTLETKFLPFLQCKSEKKNERIEENQKIELMDHLQMLSDFIVNDNMLNMKWQCFIREKSQGYLKQVPGIGVMGRMLLKLGIPLSKVLPAAKSVSVLNALRCQSHLDAMIDSLRSHIHE